MLDERAMRKGVEMRRLFESAALGAVVTLALGATVAADGHARDG